MIYQKLQSHVLLLTQPTVERVKCNGGRMQDGDVSFAIWREYFQNLGFCVKMVQFDAIRAHKFGALSEQHATQQQQQQPFYDPLSGTPWVSQYQKKHSPIHHPAHHPIYISFFHLPRSIATSLFKLRAWQSFCTTSFQGRRHGFRPGWANIFRENSARSAEKFF